MIAPGRKYFDKKVSGESKLERITVRVLQRGIVDKTSRHYCYHYDTDKGSIIIPGFELARVIFFHNRHLVRAAYTPNGLSELAFVDRSSNPIKIRFPKSTSFPVSYLLTRKSRIHLAWLLLDQEARKSFFSIYHNFRLNNESIGFNFVPPSLIEWQLELSIQRDPNLDYLIVKRIENVVDASVSEKLSGVEIHHPKKKFKAITKSKSNGKRGKKPSVDIDPELDIGELPALGKRLHSQKLSGFSFNVSGIQNASLIDEEKSSSSAAIQDKEQIETEVAGVGAPDKEGAAQEFEPVINQDEDMIDEAEELPCKFLIFEKVVKELGKSENIKFEFVKCGNFPKPTNASKIIFQTQDRKPLRYFVAFLKVRGHSLIILEADTSSLIKPKGASTLVLGLKEDAKTNFKEIIQHFSDSSATWRHSHIRDRSNFFETCHHPRVKGKERFLTEGEYKEKWKNKLKEKLARVLVKNQTT